MADVLAIILAVQAGVALSVVIAGLWHLVRVMATQEEEHGR